METLWQRRRILIWGKTRPELSKKYREIVCTGGVFQDTKRLVRLYPIPLRYMDDEKIFKKYQWIEADVAKSGSDTRPESFKIRADNIVTFDVIPTKRGNWDERAKWVMNDGNIYQSVEAIKERQGVDNTSLGLVKPSVVKDIRYSLFRQEEKEKFWQNYRNAISQMELPLDPETEHLVKPLSPADFRFKITFRCNDSRCQVDHQFSVLDWETDALYFTLRQKGDSPHVAAQKVVDKLQNQVCSPDNDLYFFLGNISSHPDTFTIVGLWYPKKKLSEPQNEGQLSFGF